MNNASFFMGLLTLAGYLTADGKSISPEPDAIVVIVIQSVEPEDEETLLSLGWVKDEGDKDGLTWIADMATN